MLGQSRRWLCHVSFLALGCDSRQRSCRLLAGNNFSERGLPSCKWSCAAYHTEEALCPGARSTSVAAAGSPLVQSGSRERYNSVWTFSGLQIPSYFIGVLIPGSSTSVSRLKIPHKLTIPKRGGRQDALDRMGPICVWGDPGSVRCHMGLLL